MSKGCAECNKWRQKHDHIFAEVRRQRERIEELETQISTADQDIDDVTAHYKERIALLEAVAEAALNRYKIGGFRTRKILEPPLRAAGYLGGGE